MRKYITAVAVVLLLAGCGGAAGSTTGTPKPASSRATVHAAQPRTSGPAVSPDASPDGSPGASPAPPAECIFGGPVTTCASSDPEVAKDLYSSGDCSTTTNSMTINWGDGSPSETLTTTGPDSAGTPKFVTDHSYSAQGTYMIHITGQGSGPCSFTSTTDTFRLGPAASQVDYAALGDSYSSGEGAGNYGTTAGACDRSSNAWPSQLAANNALITLEANLACSGATSEALGGNVEGQPDQLGELEQLNPKPVLITITMGGNDVGFSSIVEDCLHTNCIRDHTIQRAEQAIAGEGSLLRYDYRLVAAADPTANVILIVGYPQIFEQDHYCGYQSAGLGFKTAELVALNQLGAQLDTVIAKAVAQVNATQPTPRFHYVDVTSALQNHELCTADPWVSSVGIHTPIMAFAHPNAAGQTAIAAIVRSYLSSISAQL